jgi:hypothetical protein
VDESSPTAAEMGTGEAEPSRSLPADAQSQDLEPAELWQEALRRLQHQMAAETFVGLLRDSHLIEAADSTWTIGVRPHAVGWLANRPNPLIERTVSHRAGSEVSLEYVAQEHPPAVKEPTVPRAETLLRAGSPLPADSPPAPEPPPRDRLRPARSAFEDLLSFDPNSASGGGFWKMGHYANWFWAA